MGKSNRKGSTAEREVAQLLKEWWRQVEPDCDMARTPGSGGWRGSTAIRSDLKMAGDLMTNAKTFPFTVEIKRREAWSFINLAKGHRSPVWGWWRQCQDDAHDENGEPMLWFRRSREPWHVMLRAKYLMMKVARDDVRRFSELAKVSFGALDPKLMVGAHPAIVLATDLLACAPSLFVVH